MNQTEYQRCLDAMFKLHRFGIKLELDTVRSILKETGNPHETYRCIHIAGTNGKGSVAAMISSVLIAAGYRVGRYTSPHLVRFNERITINHQPIEDQRVVEAYQILQGLPATPRQPTFFEFTTAMALLEFRRQQVDWAVIETGMGGRMDATNIIHPVASVITNISLEHKAYLGHSLAAIAAEKAGIIKPAVPVITGVGQHAAWERIQSKAVDQNAPVYKKGRDFKTRRNGPGRFSYFGMNHTWRDIELSLAGEHQVENAALVLAVCEVLMRAGHCVFDEHQIRGGLAQTRWPGRLELVRSRPDLILDGAHNLMAARVLAHHLATQYESRPKTLVIGILDDKPYHSMLRDLASLCRRVILTQPAIDRALPVSVLEPIARAYCQRVEIVPQVDQAVQHALATSGPEEVICVAGSLYVVGEAKTALADGH